MLSFHQETPPHRLTTWNHDREGRIRLSTDEGPSAREFLDDDYDDDNERLGDEEPLAVTAQRLRNVGAPTGQSEGAEEDPALLFEAETDELPSLPAKP